MLSLSSLIDRSSCAKSSPKSYRIIALTADNNIDLPLKDLSWPVLFFAGVIAPLLPTDNHQSRVTWPDYEVAPQEHNFCILQRHLSYRPHTHNRDRPRFSNPELRAHNPDSAANLGEPLNPLSFHLGDTSLIQSITLVSGSMGN